MFTNSFRQGRGSLPIYFGGIVAAVVLGMIIGLHGALTGALFGTPDPASAGKPSLVRPNCPAQNLIQRENCRLGTTDWELTQPADKGQIAGYAWKTSVGAGETLAFSVSTTSASFDADIYRMGWYGGDGGRLVLSKKDLAGRRYLTPSPDPVTGLVDCRWPAAFRVAIPGNWVSGIYLVQLTASRGYQAYIPFVVRDNRPSQFVFVHAVNTDEAYNTWGGKSLYTDMRVPADQAYAHRAVEVSFDRPFAENFGAGNLFYWEYPMLRWLEREGYDVDYVSGVDVHESESVLLHHRAILVVGHNEYWSKEMRDHFDTAVARGVSLGVFAADTGAWAIRYQSSPLTGPDRIMVCYKYPDGRDPYVGVDNSRVTAEWRNPILNRPESLLIGAMYDGIEDPTKNAAWVATRRSSQLLGGAGPLKGLKLPGLVGYEYDSVLPGYPLPPHLVVLSASPVVNQNGRHDVANSTLYVAKSGATVFNAGTIQWSWGLDGFYPPWHTRPSNEHWPNSAVQRVTRKLLVALAGHQAAR